MVELNEPSRFDDDFTTEHAERMLDFYCKTLTNLGFRPEPYPDVDARIGTTKFETPRFDTLNHALWMCQETARFLRAGRYAKAYRWIGTIQGILFMNGVFSISELKEHNRFDPPPASPPRR